MTTIVLLRHGLTAMTGPRLAGWTPGVHLDDRGKAQAAEVAERLRAVPFAAIVSSPWIAAWRRPEPWRRAGRSGLRRRAHR